MISIADWVMFFQKIFWKALFFSCCFIIQIQRLARSNSFDVYCTLNGDLTASCSGCEGDQDLTCVSNFGGSLSCQSTSGQSFVCITNGDTTSCKNENGTDSQTTQCTFDVAGTSSCAQPDQQSPPFLDVPSITAPSVEIPDHLMNPSLSLPSVFW